MVNIIILAHEEFGTRLLECAESIAGRQTEGIRNVPVKSEQPIESIKKSIEQAVLELNTEDGLILLVDMPGGTPMNIAIPIVKDLNKCSVICGVNVNMALTAITARNNLPFEKLSAKILEDGRKSICEVKNLLTGSRQL